MAIKTVLFDLDGTLIPFTQDDFVKTYFGLLVKKFKKFDPKFVVKAIWEGTKAMQNNDGTMLNSERFWQVFGKLVPVDLEEANEVFLDFYANDFNKTKDLLGIHANRSLIVNGLKQRGYNVILATNPLFPPVAVESRLKWIGLDYDDFKYITTFENSSYCKPNLNYYKEILKKFDLEANECIMIGNNIEEDGAAAKLGMDCFIVEGYIEGTLEGSGLRHGSLNEIFQELIRA
ncbi:MAG: HAD family hydrolase [Christensenellaceae bacterium]|nr:HAD family hydrolase [Christensenellaceae bacterium]